MYVPRVCLCVYIMYYWRKILLLHVLRLVCMHKHKDLCVGLCTVYFAYIYANQCLRSCSHFYIGARAKMGATQQNPQPTDRIVDFRNSEIGTPHVSASDQRVRSDGEILNVYRSALHWPYLLQFMLYIFCYIYHTTQVYNTFDHILRVFREKKCFCLPSCFASIRECVNV